MLRIASRRVLATMVTAVTFAACTGDEITAPREPVEGSLTVDASEGWAYASLTDAGPVSITDPAASAEWDIGFNAANVMLNGGAAGPGDVSGYCRCANAGATDEQVLAMTAESELGDFDAVTGADIPAGGFTSEALVPAISQWYTGSGANAVADGATWLLRLRNGTSYAKLRVVSLTGSDASDAGQATLEYAVQPTAADPFGETETVVLDAGSGATLDLTSGTIDGTEWDVSLEGFTFRMNSGVSGSGNAAATRSESSFEAVTTASVDARAYRQDGFGGVFTASPWYRYNLTDEHIVHPTYQVYLLQRGSDVYKVQVVDYYGTAGEPRRITFRYAKLTD